jgi:hypothetical protein
LKGNIKTRRSRQQGYGQQAHKAVADYNIGNSIEIWRFATGKSAPTCPPWESHLVWLQQGKRRPHPLLKQPTEQIQRQVPSPGKKNQHEKVKGLHKGLTDKQGGTSVLQQNAYGTAADPN